MEKVIVSKEQAEAIKTILLLNGGDKTDTLSGFKCWKGKLKGSDLKPLNNISEETLALALFVGYEVEKTAEDRLAELYKGANSSAQLYAALDEWSNSKAEASKAKGIRLALDTLGIKIKGVNA